MSFKLKLFKLTCFWWTRNCNFSLSPALNFSDFAANSCSNYDEKIMIIFNYQFGIKMIEMAKPAKNPLALVCRGQQAGILSILIDQLSIDCWNPCKCSIEARSNANFTWCRVFWISLRCFSSSSNFTRAISVAFKYSSWQAKQNRKLQMYCNINPDYCPLFPLVHLQKHNNY